MSDVNVDVVCASQNESVHPAWDVTATRVRLECRKKALQEAIEENEHNKPGDDAPAEHDDPGKKVTSHVDFIFKEFTCLFSFFF